MVNIQALRGGCVFAGADDEIGAEGPGALMQKLMESVLPVRPFTAPEYRHRVNANRAAVQMHALAVAFHLQLLKVVGQQTQALAVRQDDVICGAEEVAVPHAEQSHDQRPVVFRRGRPKMLVHLVRAVKKLGECFGPCGQQDGQAHR